MNEMSTKKALNVQTESDPNAVRIMKPDCLTWQEAGDHCHRVAKAEETVVAMSRRWGVMPWIGGFSAEQVLSAVL